MSTNSQNINISQNNVQGKCDLKCSYSFKYPESNITAKNNGIMISLTYENSGSSPVIYNTKKYDVSTISIVCPSVHLFNNASAAAEIIIEHTPVSGGQLLNVCIPIMSSSQTNTESNLITEIIENVSTNAPAEGETINLNISNFTLDNIIPKKPFFSYIDTQNTSWIVFGITNAIPLNSSTLSTLTKIITPYSLNTTSNGLFFNSTGPTNGTNIGDGIYISCQPTGSSEDEIAVSYNKNTSNNNINNILSNPTTLLIFQIILGCILFIIIFLSLNYLYKNIIDNNTKMIKIPKIPGINK
jgi:hypothetical protein